ARVACQKPSWTARRATWSRTRYRFVSAFGSCCTTPHGATPSVKQRARTAKASAGSGRRRASRRCVGGWPVRLLQNLSGNPRRGGPIEVSGAARASLAQRVAQGEITDRAFETAAD